MSSRDERFCAISVRGPRRVTHLTGKGTVKNTVPDVDLNPWDVPGMHERVRSIPLYSPSPHASYSGQAHCTFYCCFSFIRSGVEA